MKFVFTFVALVSANLYFFRAGNASGNQNVCASPGCPININVHGNGGTKGEKGEKGTPCHCPLQNSNKPSAHIEAVNKREVTYQSKTVIKDFSTSAPNSHLAGGMTYQDGKLTVPTPGRYYIYAQIYYHNRGRVNVNVNNKVITMIQPPTRGTDTGGGVFNLKAGDVITLTMGTHPIAYAKIYMYTYHSYFGAYMI